MDLPLFNTPQAWRGPALTDRDTWIHHFSPSEIDELDAAVATLDASGRDILDIGIQDFPLPRLGQTLARFRREVLHGRGFHLLRGLPIERYTLRQAAIAYWVSDCTSASPCPKTARGTCWAT